jgi:hypothetical protein
MLLEVAAQLGSEHGLREFRVNVIGVEETRRGLVPEMPEQPLFGDALGDEAHGARLRATRPRLRVRPLLRIPSFPFRFGQHFLEAKPHPAKEPLSRTIVRIVGRIGELAIRFVSARAHGNEVHVDHVWVYDSIRRAVPCFLRFGGVRRTGLC